MAELRELFEDGITARAIFEPLYCCFASDPVSEVREQLDRLNFDEVGVKQDVDHPPYGYVRRDLLRADQACSDCARPFGQADLIADTTPLVDVLYVLRDSPRRYVLEGRTISGIVTRADLEKPPVRMLVFGLATLLEMHLTFLVRALYEGGTWQRQLSEVRLGAARKLFEMRQSRNEDLDLVDCLQLCDKRDLVARDRRGQRALGFSSRRQGERALKQVEGLRDRVAHAQGLVQGADWGDVVDSVVEMERMIASSEQYLEEANGV